VKAIEKVEIR